MTTMFPTQLTMSMFSGYGAREVQPERPLRLVFLTSVRDTGACDQNGRTITYPDGERYMQGVIEATVEATRPGGMLHGICEVVLIITDDHPTDQLNGYPCAPTDHMPWLHPLELCLPNGQLVRDITVNQPSMFRKLPLCDRVGRLAAKLEFERLVHQLFQRAEGDVLISDHYMARIQHLIGNEMGLMGRVINIHPAITLAGHEHCMRGPTPTTDAIERARNSSNGSTITGATLHFVNAVIDDGPVIALCEGTPVYKADEPQQLRDRNYAMAKVPLFLAGLWHYVHNLYPHLDTVDINSLERC